LLIIDFDPGTASGFQATIRNQINRQLQAGYSRPLTFCFSAPDTFVILNKLA